MPEADRHRSVASSGFIKEERSGNVEHSGRPGKAPPRVGGGKKRPRRNRRGQVLFSPFPSCTEKLLMKKCTVPEAGQFYSLTIGKHD